MNSLIIGLLSLIFTIIIMFYFDYKSRQKFFKSSDYLVIISFKGPASRPIIKTIYDSNCTLEQIKDKAEATAVRTYSDKRPYSYVIFSLKDNKLIEITGD